MIAHYEPATYISTTILPDLQGAAQNGNITWGTNPTGTSVSFGSLISTETTSIPEEGVESPGVAGEVNAPENIYPTETEMAGVNVIGYFLLNSMATDTDTPVQFFWWLLVGIFVIMAVTAGLRYSGNSLWIAGLAAVGAMGVAVAMVLLPGWVIVVAVILVTGAAIWERTPAM